MRQRGAGVDFRSAPGLKTEHAVFAEWRVCLSEPVNRTDRTWVGHVGWGTGSRLHILQITMRLAVFRLVFLAVIFVGINSALAQAPASIPSFMLKKFEGDEMVSLDQFSDGVVVLDFFAYWCVPCRKVSTELEEHVQIGRAHV